MDLAQTSLGSSLAATYPSWRPTRRLDHLFFSPHFRILRAGVFARFPFSDHLPLVVEAALDG